jgi:outer membrane protein assembly factor BamB
LRGRRLLLATAVALLALVAAGIGVVVALRAAGRDVQGSPTVEFTTQPPPRPAPPQLEWPQYGRDARRSRVAPSRLRPPFRVAWVFHGGSLLEFPPALAYGRLYLPTFAGLLVALDSASGRVLWRYRSHRCAWASPAVADGLVFQTFLLRPPHCANDVDTRGELVAFDARSGAVRWRVALPATESSPLVVDGLVIVGDWSGAVTAFDERSGHVRWTTRLGGAVKASAAAAGGRVFVGAYDGRMYALDLRTGRIVWRASAQPRLGGRGRFYATAAIAHGRVYAGATDGKMYSFGAASGALRWSHSTGGYVYSSPAAWRGLVLAGSYDGHLYAFDAATGAVRWSFAAGGPISGSPSVLGGVVYVSTLAERTFALDVRGGRPLWSFPDGKYSPAVADAVRLYLVGYDRLFGMVPRRGRRYP